MVQQAMSAPTPPGSNDGADLASGGASAHGVIIDSGAQHGAHSHHSTIETRGDQ